MHGDVLTWHAEGPHIEHRLGQEMTVGIITCKPEKWWIQTGFKIHGHWSTKQIFFKFCDCNGSINIPLNEIFDNQVFNDIDLIPKAISIQIKKKMIIFYIHDGGLFFDGS